MPTLPLTLDDGVPIDGGDLPAASAADVAAEWAFELQQPTTAPIRDAIQAGETAMLQEYERRSQYAAGQSDRLRATSEYLDEIGNENGIDRQDGETDVAYMARVNGIQSVTDPNDIIAAVNAILAPFTAVQARYLERSDGCFVGDGTTTWSSHAFRGTQATPYDLPTPITTNNTPNYPDRLYGSSTPAGLKAIANRMPGRARVFNGLDGRYFEIRIPDLAPLDQSVPSAFDGTQANVAGGFFAGNGTSGINTTFLWSSSASEVSVYNQIVSTVEKMRGHSMRWTLLVDPCLSALPGPSGALATPAALFGASLVLDLDSRFTTNNGTLATVLQDQSGSANNCTGSVGWSAVGVNGLPKLTLNGSQSLTSSTNVVAAGTARTVYAVSVPTATASIVAQFMFRLASPYCTLLSTQAAGGNYINSDGVAFSTFATGNPTSGVHLYCWKFPSFVTTAPIYMLDGSALAVTGTVGTSDTGTAGYQAYSDAASQGWLGDGYRILVVNRLTTPAEDLAIHDMMISLYGTP